MRRLPLTVVAKPNGAACNLDCTYCFFLSKEVLHDASGSRMGTSTLEAHIAGQLAALPDGEVELTWQGGEPTMRGLPFFVRAVELSRQLARPEQQVRHSLQTNATLITDEWGEFLARERFLVGVSVDGPADLHDAHRVNRAGRGTHAQVLRGWEILQRHGVECNVLTTVNAVNADHGLRVYRHLRDDLGARFMQFIPVLERVPQADLARAEAGWRDENGVRLLYRQTGNAVTSRSVTGPQLGAFLVEIFDEWVMRDVGEVFVQAFDEMLGARLGRHRLCVTAPECGTALAVEANGDVYSCDHFVEPGYLLGNVHRDRYTDLLASPEQRAFGSAKRTGLTSQCRSCPVRWACNGGCPKDRFAVSRDGEEGHNHLCEGYHRFFTHATPAIELMAGLVLARRPAAEVMSLLKD